MDNSVLIHYHSRHSNYFKLSLWTWRDGKEGSDSYFSCFNSVGAMAKVSFPLPFFLPHCYVIVKDQHWNHHSSEFRIDLTQGGAKKEVWLIEGDDTVYYSRQAAVASHAYSRRQPRAFDMAVNSRAFDRKWGFDGWLGFSYQETQTDFRLWAPTAERVELVLYNSTDESASVHRVITMTRGEQINPNHHEHNTIGLWSTTVQGDLNYQAYCYRVYHRKRTFSDTRDPYTIATTANGRRSIVVASHHLKPEHFEVKHGKEAFWRLDNPNQAVIYETHIRDFSKSETSGVSPENRGLFKGFHESGTRNRFGDVTGFDYVRSLGVNYVQLQPIFDHHQNFDSDGNYAYNWGYDPENYNVPEASFSSNPHEPATRVLELKSLIQDYHDSGLGVIMDVVYNHTFSSTDSAFQMTVPDYYYRMNPNGTFQNGSGCGNETASEKEMYRKYMIDSILYWAKEYNIDGFRFDLMGLHDVETMNRIRAEVDKIDPRILIFGEGWDMGTGLAPEQKAKKDNARLMPRIGFFNDDQRNAVKGAEVYGDFKRGFVSGEATEDKIAKAVLGSDELSSYLAPKQVVNYVEAHDNYNLNDLLLALHPEDDAEQHRHRVELAGAMNLLMQGMSFMQIGQEFLRTKLFPTGNNGQLTQADRERAMNAYNAPDNVNQINWEHVTTYKTTIDFMRKMIAWKTKTPYFSYPTYEDIRKHVFVEEAESGTGFVKYTIEDDKKIEIVFNGTGKRLQKPIESGIIISNHKKTSHDKSTLEDLSVMILDITE